MKNINYYINTLSLLFIVFISCEKKDVEPTNALPKTSFTFKPNPPIKGEIVSFTDESTDSDGDIKSWLWNFGEGKVSKDQNPTHTFTHSTKYDVILTVKDDKGGEGTLKKSLVVSDPDIANVLPTALFSVSENLVQKGVEVQFTDNSTDTDGLISSWSWDFGDDSSTDTRKDATHFYNTVGTFTTTLTVTDNLGDTADYTKIIEVWGVKWSYTVGEEIKNGTAAIADDGTIYIGSYDDKVHAINPDGTEKWTFTTAGNIRNSPSIGSDGTIYIGSDDDNLYALNPVDGTEKWHFDTGGNVNLTTNAIGSDGTIYIGSTFR